MIFHLRIVGVLLIGLALSHIAFQKYFNWNKDLGSLNLINRQIMTVHTFFVALTIFLMGMLCLTSSRELLETNLGKKISLGLGLFWTIRLFVQFFVFSSELWRGKSFETRVHILFIGLWTYLSLVFWTIALQ